MDNNSAADISKKRTGREVTVYNEDSDSALINNDIHLEPLVKGPSINCTNKLTKTAKKLKIKDEYLEVGDICYVSPSNEDSIESYYSIVLVEAFFGKVIKGKSLLRYHDLTKYLKLNDANVLCKDPQELFLSNIVKDVSKRVNNYLHK